MTSFRRALPSTRCRVFGVVYTSEGGPKLWPPAPDAEKNVYIAVKNVRCEGFYVFFCDLFCALFNFFFF